MVGLLGRHSPLTEAEKRRLASLLPRPEVFLSTPRQQEPTGRAYRYHGEAEDVRKAQIDARHKANIAKLRNIRLPSDPDKRRLQQNINASIQQADTEYEFSFLENARKRLDYLRRAKEEAGENYTGPPIIDFSEVIKQGLRGNRPMPQYIGLDSSIWGVYNPRNTYGEPIPDAIHVDPGKHTSSVVPFTRGSGSTPREHLSVGYLKRPLKGKPIIETEMHEIAHRVARTLIDDPLFKRIHAEANKERAHTRSGNLLPFLYKDGDSFSFFIDERYAGNPHQYRDPADYSREHKMIRAATEGSDPTKTAKERNFSKSKHTTQAKRDAKQFNELVGLYAVARRKVEMQEAEERRRRELELARSRRENNFEKSGWPGYERLKAYKEALENNKQRMLIPPPEDNINKSGLL